MRRFRSTVLVALMTVLAAMPATAASGTRTLAAWRAPVPNGGVSVSLSCSIVPSGGRGAWIAGFTVDADETGLTESFVTALGWWGDGHVEITLRSGDEDLLPPVAVDIVPASGSYRVTIQATWGGWHRRWPATLRSGCATSQGSVGQAATLLNGAPVPGEEHARLVTAGAEAFGDVIALQGATLASGSISVEAGYLMGIFSARHGAISATTPDGSTTHEGGVYPSIPVRSGFGGTWRFDAAGALSDDPYLLTALAFDRR